MNSEQRRHNEEGGDLRIILLATQPRMLREMLHRALEKTPEVQLVLEMDDPGSHFIAAGSGASGLAGHYAQRGRSTAGTCTCSHETPSVSLRDRPGRRQQLCTGNRGNRHERQPRTPELLDPRFLTGGSAESGLREDKTDSDDYVAYLYGCTGFAAASQHAVPASYQSLDSSSPSPPRTAASPVSEIRVR